MAFCYLFFSQIIVKRWRDNVRKVVGLGHIRISQTQKHTYKYIKQTLTNCDLSALWIFYTVLPPYLNAKQNNFIILT